MERIVGFEPASSAWKAEVLPLNDIRILVETAGLAPAGKLFHADGLRQIIIRYCASPNRSRTCPVAESNERFTYKTDRPHRCQRCTFYYLDPAFQGTAGYYRCTSRLFFNQT